MEKQKEIKHRIISILAEEKLSCAEAKSILEELIFLVEQKAIIAPANS